MQEKPKIKLGANFKKSLAGKKRDRFHIEHGDNLEVLRKLTPHQFDSLVTDPPAGIAFMGKDWDTDKGGRDHWIAWLSEVLRESYRVLKPGAHGVIWSLPKTSHWTAMAIEDAGFEIVDCVMHIFGSGFPKSQDIAKMIDKNAGAEREVLGSYRAAVKTGVTQGFISGSKADEKGRTIAHITAPATADAERWDGWGTMLKPAYEPWWLIRKPISESSIARNVLKHGVGGLNIEASRVGNDPLIVRGGGGGSGTGWGQKKEINEEREGRFPANVIFDEDAATVLDEQSGTLKSGKPSGTRKASHFGSSVGNESDVTGFGDIGGASRFFYVAKAAKSDKGDDNGHPTVKSTKLMEYLIKMVTPPNGTVLDPFMGSGTTGVSAIRNDFNFFGIDQEKKYTELARSRMLGVYSVPKPKKSRSKLNHE